MSDEEQNCPDCEEGLPAWMGTFADLMSLLMCFFVLLLSFSEMDAMKFKRLAGSLANAFGVQAKVNVTEVPKGTSVIAQNFSPGKPDPTPINVIYQHTDKMTETTLDIDCSQEFDLEQGEEALDQGVKQEMAKQLKEKLAKLMEETKQDAVDLAKALNQQITQGQVEIETNGRKIVIRIREKGSFSSGSAYLADDYIPVLRDVRDVLMSKEGQILIQGHTDDIPIKTARYRSNYELSSSRAVSVAEELLYGGLIDSKRVSVSGFADTKPLAANDSKANRARNRRVEIVIHQPIDKETKQQVEELKAAAPELLDKMKTDKGMETFNLDPSEVF